MTGHVEVLAIHCSRRDLQTPQRRTALVAKELERYNIDIAAISETRLAGEGSLTEPNSGYTFFWKGKAEQEARIHGVGFAIKSSLLRRIPDIPTGINERLMKIRIPVSKKRFITLISVYAPILTSAEEDREQFYADLDSLLLTIPASDKLLILGDFNARVGNNHEQWKGVIGKHGLGKANSNGLLLLSKCAEHNLVITNTMFRQANKYKTTWMHPRSKQWHLIDYVVTRQRDSSDVLITRVMSGADCWTDHRLVRSKCRIYIPPQHHKRSKIHRPAFNTDKLQSAQYQQEFQTSLDDKIKDMGPPPGGPEEKWSRFKEAVTKAARTVLGPKTRHHQDWFDENDEHVQALLDEKRKAYIDWQNHPNCESRHDRYKSYKARVQKELRTMRDKWWEQKAEEMQQYTETNNSKMLFGAIKTIYGPTRSKTAPLTSADGSTVIKDKEGIRERWKEHFSKLLNRPSTVDQTVLEQIPQRTVREDLDLPPSEEEVRTAIKQMNSGKAPGREGIPAELYKSLGTEAFKAFHALITNISEISLPEAQCGFRPGRSTTDMVFAVRQVQEKCIEQHMDLYAVFIDLTKAFDSINREALWSTLTKLGCPRKFTTLIKLFHENMTGQILTDADYSASFNITTGVKQACVLAPVLFNLYFTQVLLHTVKDLDLGVYIKYRSDGSVFDLRRLTARTKTVEKLIQEALFADDCALMAHRENHLQVIVDRFLEASKMFGLTISLGKTVVLVQPAPNTTRPLPNITIDTTQLKCVEHFPYLGSTISADGSLDREVSTRIQKASQALGRLRVKVLQQRGIKLTTKIKIYKAVVLTSLLYGCESWTLYRRHVKQLEQFHMRSLRRIMDISWQDRVTNQQVLDLAQCTSVKAIVLKSQLRWTGHVIRMSDDRIPRQLMYGELKLGFRKRGRPKLRYKDTLKNNLKWCGIKPSKLESMATDRTAWRALIFRATTNFEEERRQRLNAARAKRHRAAATAVQTADHQCTTCGRLCASSFGLRSHMRAHPP
ncbi:Hypp666 [Branchiostoma lanceolatum]|uniref:Hypp666 protein n=1 Tax=Branchiostoma lanceolatum TaxID=7740 RepID=A0A8J9W1D0_BRALA|nr:Hypp666 [Branchiostoma lanceolatum]